MEALKDGFTGECFCGAVRFAVSGPPRFAYLCHCSDCRRINGSAFHTGLVVEAADFQVTCGSPATFASRADSGNTITRAHCVACGTQLFSTTTADAAIVSIKAGAVTSVPPETIVPSVQIFWDSRVAWAEDVAGLTTYAEGIRGAAPIR